MNNWGHHILVLLPHTGLVTSQKDAQKMDLPRWNGVFTVMMKLNCQCGPTFRPALHHGAESQA